MIGAGQRESEIVKRMESAVRRGEKRPFCHRRERDTHRHTHTCIHTRTHAACHTHAQVRWCGSGGCPHEGGAGQSSGPRGAACPEQRGGGTAWGLAWPWLCGGPPAPAQARSRASERDTRTLRGATQPHVDALGYEVAHQAGRGGEVGAEGQSRAGSPSAALRFPRRPALAAGRALAIGLRNAFHASASASAAQAEERLGQQGGVAVGGHRHLAGRAHGD